MNSGPKVMPCWTRSGTNTEDSVARYGVSVTSLNFVNKNHPIATEITVSRHSVNPKLGKTETRKTSTIVRTIQYKEKTLPTKKPLTRQVVLVVGRAFWTLTRPTANQIWESVS